MNTNVIDFDASKRAGDHIVRGTAADGQVRAIAISARATVQKAHEIHATSPLVTAALGRLMMAGQMMGALFKSPDELITLTVAGDGPVGGLTVTANNKGQVKGFANNPHAWLPLNAVGHLDVGGGLGHGMLTVVRDQPGIEPYSSQVELVSGEIGDDLSYYFAMSDQVPTSLGVGVLVNRDTSVRQAGGFIVQLMPGATDEVASALEANVKRVSSITTMLEEGLAPADMLERVLSGLDFEELEVMPASFHCGCNEDRAERAVRALGRAELTDMIEKGEPAETVCNFCGKRYLFGPDRLRAMLAD